MSYQFLKKYYLEEIEEMPVLHQGQFDNLLLESDEYRLWHSRMTEADGATPNQITIEQHTPRGWKIYAKYQAVKRPIIEGEE